VGAIKGEVTSDMVIATEELLVKKVTGKTLDEIASGMNMSERALFRLRQDPTFREYYRRRSMEIAEDSLHEILNSLVEKARNGHTKSQEIYLKSLGFWGEHGQTLQLPPKDDRSTEAINAEIDELRKRLGFTDEN
jgi:methylphosphotriester-DNA--protein-cysteine methyltransferase